MTTIQQAAQQMYDKFIQDKRNDGTKFWKLALDRPEWMKEVVFAAHDEGGVMPNDTTYEFIKEAACVLSEMDEDTDEDAARDAIYEQIEPDVYTSQLTGWLDARNDHVYYLTEVLEEFGGDIKDGFQLLGLAQQKHKHEVAFAVLEAIMGHIAEEEPEEEE